MGLGVTVLAEVGRGPVVEAIPPKGPRKLLSIRQVCERLGVSRRTLYNWMNDGKLTFVKTPGGSRRIYEDLLVREARD